MALPPPVLFDPAQHQHLIPAIAQIHADCVLLDGTLATYLPDPETGRMDMAALQDFWRANARQVAAGDRVIALQFAGAEEGREELAGYVSLYLPFAQSGPFRSLVEKLLVSPRHRRKGIARRLMATLEDVARDRHRELMVLDTTIGTPAEHMYLRLGYKEFGRIPRYGVSPKDRSLVDEVFYYKDLRDEA